jgi:predicted transposase/invertase (TIGR01784 family)
MAIMNEKYINPLTDFGFKKLFGTEPNKHLLIDFLNQILPDNRKVANLTYGTTDKVGRTEFDRKAIFDLSCVGEDGEKFIVEMQKAKQNYFKDRSVFYASFPIQEQAKKGEWNYKLQAVYSIGILDFVFDDHKTDKTLHHIVELKNQRGEIFYDKLKFIYIELPKFNKTEAELETHFDKWLFVLTHLSKLQDRPRQLQERVFKNIFEVAEIAKFKPKELKAYEESLKRYRDLFSVMETKYETGKEDGIVIGREEGREEGIIEMIKNLIDDGFSDERVAKISKKPIEFVQKIRKERNL